MAAFDQYFKCAFTVDNVVFGFDESDLKVLLIYRGAEPFKGMWALPGDFVNPDEDLDTAGLRVLKALTGIDNVYMEQVEAHGVVKRHPYGRVITISYYSLVKIVDYKIDPSSWAKDAKWFSVKDIPDLAFDHETILSSCLNRLKRRVRIRPIGFELLPEKFTLTQLQQLYEAVLSEELDKRNFRKKIISMKILIDLNESQEGVAHRPARLYSFDKERYLGMGEDHPFKI